MVPRTVKGRGFKGAAAYVLHDKGKDTSERVRFTHTLNTVSNDPNRAINEMCFTANSAHLLKMEAGSKTTGRKLTKPVFAFSLSWHEQDQPSDLEMMRAAHDALKFLQMDEYQALMVAHNDTDHPHVHVIVNRVHPVTGIAHDLSCDHNRFSDWAREYQREHGQNWCPQREINHAERQKKRREKAQGKEKSAFVKDKKSQRNDRPAAFDRRAEAMKARQQKKLDQEAARDAKKTEQELYRAPDIFPTHDPIQAAKAFLQQKADETRQRKDKQAALDKAAAIDAKKTYKELYRVDDIAPPHDPVKAAQAFQQQREDDAKRQKFEQWILKSKLAQHEKHLAERDKVSRMNTQRLQQAEERIEQAYGEQRRQYQRQLAVLEERAKKGGLSRFVGQLRGDDEQREVLQKNLSNIEQRSQEIREPVEFQNSYDVERLHSRQQKESRDLDTLIDRQKETQEIPKEPPREQARSVGKERGFER